MPKEIDPLKNKKKFKEYKIGFVHIDITSVQTKEGVCYIFVGVERKSKFVYLEIFKNMTTENACKFLENLINYFPFKIHRLLTDNVAQFTFAGLLAKNHPPNRIHPFLEICNKNKIKQKLTKLGRDPKSHLWYYYFIFIIKTMAKIDVKCKKCSKTNVIKAVHFNLRNPNIQV